MIAAAEPPRGWYRQGMTDPARHRRRLTRTAAWACALLAMTLLALLMVSVFGHVWVARGATYLGVSRGVFVITWGYNNPTAQILAPTDGSAALRWRSYEPGLDWWFRRRVVTWTPLRNESLPLWIPIVVLSGLCIGLFRRLRGRDPNMCARCGYDLRGLSPDARCPECGRVTSRPASS